MSSSATEVALSRTELFADPRALLEELGAPGPVHRVTLPDGMPAWLVTGHNEARTALSDPRLRRSIRVAAPELRPYLMLASDEFVLNRHMLFADPPDHTRLRKLVSQAFTARRIERLRPRIQEITDELVDAIAPCGEADLMEALALPLPITVICEMLGVPLADRDDFQRHADVLIGVNGVTDPNELIETGVWFDRYLAEMIAERRREPRDDLISALLAAQEADDRLTDVEVRSSAFLLLTAGFETTVNLMANGLLALLGHPDRLAALYADPELVPAAVEEFLRYDSPVSSVLYRFATEPMTIGGVEIQPGEHVAVSLPAANYDPERFPDPHVLNLGRNTNGHLSFGHGIHFCLGAPLARLEGQIAVGTLLRRLAGLELAVPVEMLTWKPSFIVHHLHRLPVRFTVR
jgi:cytochrome P450